MKTFFKTLALIACICAVACSEEEGRLPKSTVKNLVTEELRKDNILNQYETINVGYYEENNRETRLKLRKLAAAGMITYDVERFRTSARVKDGYTFDYDSYTFEDNYKTVTRYRHFVNVALTNDGMKYVVSQIPKYKEPQDPYLAPLAEKEYPEDAVKSKEVFDENGKGVFTLVEEEEPKEKAEKKDKKKEDSKPTKKQNTSDDQENKSDLQKAKERENKVEKYVKTQSLKVTDVRNILIRDDVDATAEVVVDTYNVSPFGRIYDKVQNGEHRVYKLTLLKYEDKGWVVTKMTKKK